MSHTRTGVWDTFLDLRDRNAVCQQSVPSRGIISTVTGSMNNKNSFADGIAATAAMQLKSNKKLESRKDYITTSNVCYDE